MNLIPDNIFLRTSWNRLVRFWWAPMARGTHENLCLVRILPEFLTWSLFGVRVLMMKPASQYLCWYGLHDWMQLFVLYTPLLAEKCEHHPNEMQEAKKLMIPSKCRGSWALLPLADPIHIQVAWIDRIIQSWICSFLKGIIFASTISEGVFAYTRKTLR